MTDRPSITMKEIAQRANVSVATISRVLNNREYVRDDVRRRVLEVIDEAGYEPDHMARSLRTRATHTVGFIVRDLLDLVFAAMAQGADSVLGEHGYTMLLATSGLDAELDTRRFAHLRQRHVDGFILAVSDERNEQLVAEMGRASVPIVLVDREMTGVTADAVITDYRPGTDEAVRYLAELGHRRIGYIGGDQRLRPGRERWLAIERAFAAQGLTLDASLAKRESFATEFGYEQTRALIDTPDRPSAIIAGGNQIAVGVLQALHDSGLRIPDDISVISYDDTDLLRVGTPPVSVISRPLIDTGRLAAEQLLARLNQEPPGRFEPVSIVLPTKFEVRESCRAHEELSS
ncbi:MAG: LacI family transcriptional regulator [Thermomicrobiales bacterium]|nr:LacI family transcriptional regulator [Thermomicrobiales bacterium]